MSHEDRVYRRYGLHVVRISAYKRDGFTLLISGQDEPDQFLSSQERIPLAGDRRALVRMLRSLSDGSGLGPRVEGLSQGAGARVMRRRFSPVGG